MTFSNTTIICDSKLAGAPNLQIFLHQYKAKATDTIERSKSIELI
jgi:hypothetical protein